MLHNVKHTIGMRVREIRKKRFRSAAEAARCFGITPAAWGQLELGKSCPSVQRLYDIAEFLECRPGDLLGEEREDDVRKVKTYVAGGGNLWAACEDEASYEIRIPEPDRFVAYEIRGDSMEPIAREGQVILALKHVNAEDGDLAYIELDDDTATFKRLVTEGRRAILQPVNPAHNATTVPLSHIRRCLKVWGIKL